MRLSAEATYAMRAMFDIAYHDNGGPSKADQIATREDIPGKFLEQILRKLKSAGLLESRRGPKGGYTLTEAPGDITLGAIIRATEGPTEHDWCAEAEAETKGDGRTASRWIAAAIWRNLAERIDDLLDTVTVADMVERAERLGLRRAGYEGFIYVI